MLQQQKKKKEKKKRKFNLNEFDLPGLNCIGFIVVQIYNTFSCCMAMLLSKNRLEYRKRNPRSIYFIIFSFVNYPFRQFIFKNSNERRCYFLSSDFCFSFPMLFQKVRKKACVKCHKMYFYNDIDYPINVKYVFFIVEYLEKKAALHPYWSPDIFNHVFDI